jgi:hypothetical protein
VEGSDCAEQMVASVDRERMATTKRARNMGDPSGPNSVAPK